ncbi:MAG: hypothetical protein MUE40_15365 [Anaerolineae bacterium]|nr:hypothetical protein [Anaerolineae bacterium]
MNKRWYAVASVLVALICAAALVVEWEMLSSYRVIIIRGVVEPGVPLALGLGILMLLWMAVVWWREAGAESAPPPQ